MSRFGQRIQEVNDNLSTFDHAKNPELVPRWLGEYHIRLLPVEEGRENEFLVQTGRHVNFFPPEEGKKYHEVGCPRFNYPSLMAFLPPEESKGLLSSCPICDAIDKALSFKKISFDYAKGGKDRQSLFARQDHLIRVLLVDFKPEPIQETKEKIPKFELPSMKVMRVPCRTVGRDLGAFAADDDNLDVLFHPEDGHVIKLTKKNTIMGYWKTEISPTKKYPIPPEFLDESTWFPYLQCIPNTTTEEIHNLLEVYSQDIDPVIAKMALSLDAEFKALPAGNMGEASNGSTKSKLKKKLEDI